MKQKKNRESGVSEVVGEMLMVGLVVVLLTVFAAAIYTFLPTDRDPTVTVKISNNSVDRCNVTLWHKGGDAIRADDLTIIIGNETNRSSFSGKERAFVMVPDKQVFDLGSNITVRLPHGLEGNETVRLVTPRAVLARLKVSL